LGFLRRSKEEEGRKLYFPCCIQKTRQRRGGTGITPLPTSSQPLRAPGLAKPAQPGQRLQEQGLQYGSNGADPFPRHAQEAAEARPLPFPTDAWTRYKRPQHLTETRSLSPALLRAPPLSGRHRTWQQRGQPNTYVSGHEPSLSCIASTERSF
jgi:hypothetical protein